MEHANKKRVNAPSQLGNTLQVRRSIWEKPSSGKLKLNIVATINEGQQHFSVGLALRDSQGQFVLGKTRKLPGSVSFVEAEMVAILEGLSWLEELQVYEAITESDSLLSVNAVNQEYQNYLELGSWCSSAGIFCACMLVYR